MPDNVRRVPVLDRAIRIGPAGVGGAGGQVGDSDTLRFTGAPLVLSAGYGTGDLGDTIPTAAGGVADDTRQITIPFHPTIERGYGVQTDDGRGYRVESWSEVGTRRWLLLECSAR